MAHIPETLTRWCCQGKSCGNTTLYLDRIDAITGNDEDKPPALYAYRRQSNDNMYSDWWRTEAAMLLWLEETQDHLNPAEN